MITRPDILVLEGLNVLQAVGVGAFVSDYFDFSIFVDADPEAVRAGTSSDSSLRDTAFTQPDAYFHRYAGLDDEQATAVASDIWKRINEVNLFENILHAGTGEPHPRKAPDHSIERVTSPPLTAVPRSTEQECSPRQVVPPFSIEKRSPVTRR